MKRFFLYAMMTASVLASCSQSEDEGTSQNEWVNGGTDAAPISLSAIAPSTKISASTRSAGTVGGTGKDNVWTGQRLHIFAFQKDPSTGETYGDKIMSDKSFYDQVGIADAENTVEIKWEQGGTLYFPRSGAYDFFGYYADDALGATPQYTAEDNKLYSQFTIDGSQDLMIAKAELTEADKLLPGFAQADWNKAYSSYTARKGVQPTMEFKHLLTRLTFNIEGAGNEGPENVYVKAVRVKSRKTGKLVFAYTKDADKGAIFDAVAGFDQVNQDRAKELEKYLSLQEKVNGKMQALDADIVVDESSLPEKKADFTGEIGRYPASPTGSGTPTRIGEALLVEPNVTSYNVEIDVVQYYDKDGNLIKDVNTQRKNTYYLKLDVSDVTPPEGGVKPTKFEASTSYDVVVIVNGLMPIEIKASIGEWKNGGTIVKNPDDDFGK